MHQIEAHPSPNFGPRRGGVRPSMVVLHYTGMTNAKAALERLCDPQAEVSAHYLICEDGRVLALVDEQMRAWHAGVACWAGIDDVNSHSIGIELVNPGHELGYPPFPEPQMAALERLLSQIRRRHAIPAERVVSHACVAPGRKRDPGEKFDWRRLGLAGHAVWLDPQACEPPASSAPDPDRFQGAAASFGYCVRDSKLWCEDTLAVWQAFAMRFLPGEIAAPSGTGIAHLERLADRWPCSPPLNQS